MNVVPGLDGALQKLSAGAAVVGGAGGGVAAVATYGPILSVLMTFLNSSKAKFIKKFVVDYYINLLKASFGPMGIICGDILSAYLN